MPVVSVATFLLHTNFNTKTRTGLFETDDNNAINLDLNADTIFPDRVYLKRWKDPDSGCWTNQGQGGARKVLLD